MTPEHSPTRKPHCCHFISSHLEHLSCILQTKQNTALIIKHSINKCLLAPSSVPTTMPVAEDLAIGKSGPRLGFAALQGRESGKRTGNHDAV